MSTELELKFLLPQAQLSQLVTVLPQLGQIQQHDQAALLNAYFDTPDNWFRRHDMGLRSRLKRGKYEQTIKLAGSQHGAMQLRPEYNLPCDAVVPQLSDFPPQIWPQHADIGLLQRQLTELFRTDFSRQSWQLHCSDATVIELAYDQGQVIGGGKMQAIAELELELISGNAGQLFTLAQQLVLQLPLRTGWLSKAARGYMLAQGQRMTLPQTPGDTLLQHISAVQHAEACFEQYGDNAALGSAAKALAALARKLAEIQALARHAAVAAKLAALLAQDNRVFQARDYNLLLLAVSHYLFEHG
jgi:triphosphatase